MEKNVIIRPLISEKNQMLKTDQNKYVFLVDTSANKISVKKEVEKRFKVNVLSVNMLNKKGKQKRLRYKTGYKKDTKRAIVTLKEGNSIEGFDLT